MFQGLSKSKMLLYKIFLEFTFNLEAMLKSTTPFTYNLVVPPLLHTLFRNAKKR